MSFSNERGLPIYFMGRPFLKIKKPNNWTCKNN